MRAFQEVNGDSKKFWKIVRQLLGGKKSKSSFCEINGQTDSTKMANEINNFFSEIGPELANQIPDSLIDLDFSFDNSRPKFKFNLTNKEEVKNC